MEAGTSLECSFGKQIQDHAMKCGQVSYRSTKVINYFSHKYHGMSQSISQHHQRFLCLWSSVLICSWDVRTSGTFIIVNSFTAFLEWLIFNPFLVHRIFTKKQYLPTLEHCYTLIHSYSKTQYKLLDPALGSQEIADRSKTDLTCLIDNTRLKIQYSKSFTYEVCSKNKANFYFSRKIFIYLSISIMCPSK